MRTERRFALLAPLVVALVLLVLGALPLAQTVPVGAFSPLGRPSAHAAPGPMDARPSASTPWTPASGRSSPGMPHFRMTTVSRSVGSCYENYGPGWLAYDSADDALWVASPPDCVGVFPVSNLSDSNSVLVGSDPFGIAVDTATGDVFVTNTGSDNVSVINGTTESIVASIEVGGAPMGVAYDSATGEVYVANSGTDNVSVLSARTLGLVTTIAVGADPLGVVADPTSGQVFVANNGSDNVSVISDTTYRVVATVAAGDGPFGVAFDNASNEVFVVNSLSSNVSVVSAPSDLVVASVPVLASGIVMQGAAYDAATGMVWIGGGFTDAVVINATSRTVVGYVSLDPSGVTYDPTNGEICMTNVGNFSMGCLSTYIEGATTLTFHETGLPAATPWTVTVPGGYQVSSSDNVTFGLIPNPYNGLANFSYNVPLAAGYRPHPDSGNIVIGFEATQVNITFLPVAGYYEVNFTEAGLVLPQTWSVDLDGATNTTSSAVNSFWEPNGTYLFTVPPSDGWVPDPTNGTLVVNGSDVAQPLAFVPGPSLYQVSFVESTLPTSTQWYVVFDGVNGSSSSTTIDFQATNGTSYPYTVPATGDYAPLFTSGAVSVAGHNVSVLITFRLEVTPACPLWFNETGLPVGTLWFATVTGTQPWSGQLTASAYGPSIVIYLQAGEQGGFNVSEPAGYTASPLQGTFQMPAGGGLSVEVIDYSKNASGGGPPPAPTIRSFSAIPDPLVLGSSLDLVVLVDGGAPPLAYRYLGLPSGCSSVNTSSLSCTPGSSGNWSVEVTVTDTMGRSASAYAPVSVQAPTTCPPPNYCALPPGRSVAPTPLFLGLPGAEGYWLFGGLLALGLVAVGIDLIRRANGSGSGPPPPRP